MIAHDQIEKDNPRADLIRFRSVGETLAKHGFDVIFITLNDKGQHQEGYYKGSKVYKIPLLSKIRIIQLIGFSVLLLPVMVRARRAGKFDIIFLNSILSVPGVAIFRWLSGYGTVQFDMMGIVSEERFRERAGTFASSIAKKILSSVENYLLRRVDFITTVNDRHRQIILSRVIKPVYVVRDGIFEAVLERPAKKGERENHSSIVIIFAGQINHFRLDLLFGIMPALLSEFPNLQLKILGSGPQWKRYVDLANSMGLRKTILFEGHVSHERIFDFIEKADIAYTDDWSINGFPTKIFEYMAMGKPVIAQETESIKELLVDDDNALLYKDEEELKKKILALSRDERLRREIGENGKRMMKDHTWEIRVKTLTSIYLKHQGRGKDEVYLNH
jgi:glycosyltransferase involved in cell wall biosynthesis